MLTLFRKNFCIFIILVLINNNCYSGNEQSVTPPEAKYDKDLKHSIESGDLNAITINRNCSGNIIGKPSIDIEQILNKIKEIIPQKQKWTFLIFSETFFGNNAIMTENEVQNIVKKCNEFSKLYPKVLLHINFLHKFNNNKRPPWLPLQGIQVTDINLDRITCNNIPEPDKKNIFKYNDEAKSRISNYSILICRGCPILFYRKSTYCNEANFQIVKYDSETKKFQAGDCLYEFGDFQSHIIDNLDEEHQNLADTLINNKLICTRICYDLNKMNELGTNTKLLIINANEAPNIDGWLNKISNKDMLCLQADAYHQNPQLLKYQMEGEVSYPFYTYSFFTKEGRFLPKEHTHLLKDMLPFYSYYGMESKFEKFE